MNHEDREAGILQESRSRKGYAIWIPRLISVLAFGVVLYLFWPLIGEVRDAIGLIANAHWGWLGFAILVQWVSYGFLTQLNHILLSPFEGRISFWRMMAVLPALAFIEVAVPSAGLSGVVLRARLLGKSGYSFEASSFTLLLETVYIAVVMVSVSIAGIWYLLTSGEIRPLQLEIMAVLVMIIAGLVVWVYRAGSDRRRGLRWAGRLTGCWNRILRFFKKPEVPVETAFQRTNLFYDGFFHVKDISPMLLLGLSIGRVFLDVATLGLCFAAFRYPVPPGILLTGYGLMLVLSGLAALPGGLGLVDVSLAVIFSRLGAPGAVAVAAALCYRLIAFWLIRFAGFVSWQVVEVRNDGTSRP
jgi:uncharacterized protein (TIRG00374 family)